MLFGTELTATDNNLIKGSGLYVGKNNRNN